MSLSLPRTFHRLWIGDKRMPAEFQAFGKTWLDHHPGWEMVTWTESTLPPLRNQSLFDSAPTLAMKADIARYELVCLHGGVYIDTDFECLRSIEPLLDGVEFFAGWQDEREVAIGIIGATPGHRALTAVIDEIPQSISRWMHASVPQQTGPSMFTRMVVPLARTDAAMKLFPPDVFYPYHYTERHRRYESFPDAYAAHHWTGSWRKSHHYRVVIATDAVASLATATVLRQFALLFGPDDRIELVIALPHEPGEQDLGQAKSLLTRLGVDLDKVARLQLESLSEVASNYFDAAVVPVGDVGQLVFEVGELIGWLHRLRTAIDRDRKNEFTHEAPSNTDSGILRAPLNERLSRFKPVRVMAETPTQTPPNQAVGHRATYVGKDRLLVSTSWGGKLFMSASDLSLTPEVVHNGNYEDAFTRFLSRTLRPGDVVFDVGANVGLFTLLMAQLVGRSGCVVAYEASPDNYGLLRDNVAMNYYSDWVDVLPKAAGAKREVLQFNQSSRFRGNGSLLPHDPAYDERFMVDEHLQIDVEAESLDVHVGRFPRIHLIKIDVEGGEELVFQGMEQLIANGTVERIIFECLRSRMADHWEPMVDRLRGMVAAGWSVSLLRPNGVPHPVQLEDVISVGHYTHVLLEAPDR